LLGNLKKHYIGSISTETKAARIYDAHAILAHGLKAKTNFSYTKQQVEAFLEREDDNLSNDQFDFEEDGEDLGDKNNLLPQAEGNVKKMTFLE